MRHPELNRTDNKFIEDFHIYFRPNWPEIMKDEYFEIKVYVEDEPVISESKIY